MILRSRMRVRMRGGSRVMHRRAGSRVRNMGVFLFGRGMGVRLRGRTSFRGVSLRSMSLRSMSLGSSIFLGRMALTLGRRLLTFRCRRGGVGFGPILLGQGLCGGMLLGQAFVLGRPA